MEIADQTKLLLGLAFAVIGLGILVSARRQRGFGQRKQAGALLLAAALGFAAIGLGYVNL